MNTDSDEQKLSFYFSELRTHDQQSMRPFPTIEPNLPPKATTGPWQRTALAAAIVIVVAILTLWATTGRHSKTGYPGDDVLPSPNVNFVRLDPGAEELSLDWAAPSDTFLAQPAYDGSPAISPRTDNGRNIIPVSR